MSVLTVLVLMPSAVLALDTVPPAATWTWDDIVRYDLQHPAQPGSELRVIPLMPGPGPRDIGPIPGQGQGRVPGQGQGQVPGQGQNVPPGNVTPPFEPQPNPPLSIPLVSTSFLALLDNNVVVPPDTQGGVGAGDWVMTTLNSQVRIQTRTGNTISTVSINSFWAPLGPSGLSDPKLIFDSLTGRWFFAILDAPQTSFAENYIAVSRTGDPTGTWDFYQFRSDPSGSTWSDFTEIGMNNTWVAMTANQFTLGGAEIGVKMWAIDKAKLTQPSPVLAYTTFNPGFDTAAGFSGFTMQACNTFDALQSTLYLMDYSGYNTGGTPLLRISQITGTGSAPVWSVVPGSSIPGSGMFPVINLFHFGQRNATQKGTTFQLDTVGSRMTQPVFRNGHIWCTHSGGLPDPGTVDRTGILWYELDPAGMPAPIVQSGVVESGALTHVWVPTIAVNANDDVMLGFSRSDPTKYAEGAYAVRLATDPPGTMRSIKTFKCGEAPYVKGNPGRWGDYSATVADPADNTSFWTIQEYAAAGNHWSTWWSEIALPLPPDPPILNSYTSFATLRFTGADTLTMGASIWCPGNPPTQQASCTLAPIMPNGTGSCAANDLLATALNNSPDCTALGFSAVSNGNVVTVSNSNLNTCSGEFVRFDPVANAGQTEATDIKTLEAAIPLYFTIVGSARVDSVPPGPATVTVVHTLRHAPNYQPLTYRADVHTTLGMQPSQIISQLATALTTAGDTDVQANGAILTVFPRAVNDTLPPPGQNFDLTVRNNDKGLGFSLSPYNLNPAGVSGPLPGQAMAFQLVSVWPNPSRGYASVRFALPTKGRLDTGIYDAAGRQIGTLPTVSSDGGEINLIWDGRGAGGRQAPPGVYFVKGRFEGQDGKVRYTRGRLVVRG